MPSLAYSLEEDWRPFEPPTDSARRRLSIRLYGEASRYSARGPEWGSVRDYGVTNRGLCADPLTIEGSA